MCMKKKVVRYFQYIGGVVTFFVFLIALSSFYKVNIASVTNINYVKSIQAAHITNGYYTRLELEKNKEPIIYTDFDEAIANASKSQVSFYGKLTGYGPDCVGCGGNSACQPRQNFKGGNIYFDDSLYGKVRVVAADRSIPCGSLVKMTGISIYSEPVIAVVMDRGASIKKNHFDLLFETEKDMQGFVTQSDIKFDIIRWGW